MLVHKTYRYDDAQALLQVEYAADEGRTGRVRFATELNLTLLAADAPDRRLVVCGDGDRNAASLGARAEYQAVSSVELIDDYARATLRIEVRPEAVLWHYPVETVSNSESGLERTYQGTAFLIIWDWDVGVSPAPALTLTLEHHA